MHTIHLLALWENCSVVKAAVKHQRYLVICAIKYVGYGHILEKMEIFLADFCGADALAVAILEGVIALRRDLNAGFDATMVKLEEGGGVGRINPVKGR